MLIFRTLIHIPNYRLALAVVALTTAGCATQSGGEPSGQFAEEQPAGPPAVVVTNKEGTRFEGAALKIMVSEGAPFAQADLSGTAPDGTIWSTLFAFDPAEVGGTSVRLEPRPLEVGNGAVSILSKSSEVLATSSSGTLSYALHESSKFDGEAVTPEDILSASFAGQFVVTCWVYAETLGQQPNGQSEDGMVETRVADTEFASSFCAPLKNFR